VDLKIYHNKYPILMTQLAELVCNMCGATHSKSGRLFDPPSLAMHMTMVHPVEGASPEASGVLSCDICGVNQNYRGKKFTLPSHVMQHKKKRHPEAANHSSPPTPSQSAASPRQKTSGRRNRAATHTPANHSSHVKFCPHCGFNLAIVQAAIEFVNGAS
jgi:hypothetical protein